MNNQDDSVDGASPVQHTRSNSRDKTYQDDEMRQEGGDNENDTLNTNTKEKHSPKKGSKVKSSSKTTENVETHAHGGETKVTTNTETYEFETLDDIRPDKALEDALKKESDSQKEAFDSLIVENVRLQKDKRKCFDDLQELLARYDLKDMELLAEREKNKTLQYKVNQSESQIRVLVTASRRTTFPKDGGGTGYSQDVDLETQKHEQKIKDLQLRIIKLSEDAEEKNQKIYSLERELGKSERLVDALGNRLTEKEVDDIKRGVEKHKEVEVQQEWWNDHATDFVRTGVVRESKVCVIS